MSFIFKLFTNLRTFCCQFCGHAGILKLFSLFFFVGITFNFILVHSLKYLFPHEMFYFLGYHEDCIFLLYMLSNFYFKTNNAFYMEIYTNGIIDLEVGAGSHGCLINSHYYIKVFQNLEGSIMWMLNLFCTQYIYVLNIYIARPSFNW